MRRLDVVLEPTKKAVLDIAAKQLPGALLVDGARQIDKTFLIEEFAKREHPSYVKVDFIEDSQLASTLAVATSVRQLVEALSLASGTTVIPGQALVLSEAVTDKFGVSGV